MGQLKKYLKIKNFFLSGFLYQKKIKVTTRAFQWLASIISIWSCDFCVFFFFSDNEAERWNRKTRKLLLLYWIIGAELSGLAFTNRFSFSVFHSCTMNATQSMHELIKTKPICCYCILILIFFFKHIYMCTASNDHKQQTLCQFQHD